MAIRRLCVLLGLASCASAPAAPPVTTAPPEPVPSDGAGPAPGAPPVPPQGPGKIASPVRISGDPNILPPEPVKQEMERARETLLTGAFKVCIDIDGSVTAVTALRPSGHPDFDRLVIERARTWQYRPALAGGKPTRACTGVTLVYYQPAFSEAGARLSALHQQLFAAILQAPDCSQREQLVHQFAREHADDIAAVQREIEAYEASRAPAGSAARPRTPFSEDLLQRAAPYVTPCDNRDDLVTALFDAGFRPAYR